jgi:hypothetical protein
MKWADYCISKLSLSTDGMIDSVYVYKDDGNSLTTISHQTRGWMVQQVNKGKTFCSINKNEDGYWNKIGDFSYEGSIFIWYLIPENSTRRKTFVSYYHKDDQDYRTKFENLFEDLIVSKSVEDGDIDSDNSDGYIKQLIQKGFLKDTTVLVILIGNKTKCRKHVDWEISGAISNRVGGVSGLLGLILPDHPDYGTDKATHSLMPSRLSDNFKSGYALIRDWTDDRIKMQSYIEEAFNRKNEISDDIDNSRIQMDENTCK